MTPDFWVAVLHKRLIGDGAALPVSSSNKGVLAWAHCPSSAVTAESDPEVALVLMFANPLNFTVNVSLSASNSYGVASNDIPTVTSLTVQREFVLTAASETDGLLSVFASLNGGPPLSLGRAGEPPLLEGRVSAGGVLRLPHQSYGFVTYAGAALSACEDL